MGEKLNMLSSSILGSSTFLDAVYSGVDENTVTIGCKGTYRWINVGDRAELISNDDYNNLLPAVSDIVNAAIRDTFAVKRVHKSGPVTVVIWADGTKTIVRRAEGSIDDPYAAFCAAVTKRIYGSNSKINKMLKSSTKENGREKKK